jgi:hypothetical protein
MRAAHSCAPSSDAARSVRRSVNGRSFHSASVMRRERARSASKIATCSRANLAS